MRAGTILVANGAGAALTLGRIKILAVFLGPVGIGYLNLIGGLIEVAACISGQGFATVLNRELPRADTARTRASLVSTAIAMCGVMIVFLLAPVIYGFHAFVELPRVEVFTFLLLVVAFVASSYWRILSGLIFGLALSARYFRIQVSSGLAALLIAWALVAAGNRNFMLLALLPPLTMFLAGCWSLRRTIGELTNRGDLRRMPASQIMAASAVPLVFGALSEPLLFYYVRVATSERFGVEAVGLLQPGVQFIMLSTLIVSSLTGMTLVRWDQTREEPFSRNSMAMLVSAVAIPIVGTAFVFAAQPLFAFLVKLFFAEAFLPAMEALPWLLAGEAFRVGGFILTQTLVSHRSNRALMVPRILSLAIVVGAIEFWLDKSIGEIAQAFMLAYVGFHLSTLALWLRLHWKRRAERAMAG